jgi:O-antigen/teichoic acid export membrane protein
MGTIVETNTIGWAKPSLAQRALALWSTTTARQGTLSLVDQGVVSATNFLTGVIIARACSKEELGLYMLGFSLILLVIDLQTSLIATPYMVYAPRLKGEAHASYSGSTLIHQLALCFLIVLGLMGGEIAVRHGVGPRGLGPVLWALAAMATFITLREYARRICFACLKVKRALLLDTCIAAGQIGGLLLLARFGLLSASRAYWLVGFACGIAGLGWLWSERSFYRLRIGESLVDLKRNWTFGKWVFASGLVWAISMNLYPWLLAAFRGTSSAGVWAACLGTVALGNPAVLGVQNFLGPKIAHVYAEEGRSSLRGFVLRASVVVALPMLFFCVAMTSLGGPLVALLYGGKYAGNGLVVAVLAINLAVSIVSFSFSRSLFAIERADVDFVVNFVALFMMVTLGLWLVRSVGVAGAAFGLLIANTATSGVRYVAFRILIRPEARKQIA